LWKRWGRGPARQEQQTDSPAPAQGTPTRDPLKPWRRAYPNIRGTLIEAYLGKRSLVLTDIEALSLRFAPALWHWPTQTSWPSMLALVKLADGTELTTHQTFLALDGSSKAPIDRPRLFRAGVAPNGGGVWFGAIDPSQEFLVGEGLETTLAAMRLTGAAAGCAALSALGIRRLILPPEAKRIRIFADHDSREQGLNAAREAWRRWRAEGREARVTLPTHVGEDANNILMRRKVA
jgi:hypothetical protein